jgi:TRAP-type C4-dicarboxylate transport system permease small subunit
VASSPLEALTPVARAAGVACGWGLMGIAAATTVEIVGRKLFGWTLGGVDEVSGYALAVVSAFGFTWALVQRSHMRITLLFPRVSPDVRSALNLLAAVTLAAMAVFCAVRGGAELLANIDSGKPANTPLQTPLWIPQAFWFAGLFLFALACAGGAAHALLLWFSDRPRLNSLYGPQSLEEEVATEVSQLEQRLGPGGEAR